jgi:hypothetical protein
LGAPGDDDGKPQDGTKPSTSKGATVKRSRRGGRRPQPGGHNGHNVGNGGGQNPNRTFDSNGPEIKIRGSASNVYEKYLQLARDANASGDRIMAENYLQHAEHYFRIMAAAQVQAQQYQQQNGQNTANNQYRPPNGANEQPYVQQPPAATGTPQTSAPSFSLTEGQEQDEDDGEEESGEADAQE